MPTTILDRLFAHNTWANLAIIDLCASLADEQLDATPVAGSPWSIRRALTHLVEAEQGYLGLLTLPPESRRPATVPFADLRDAARRSGEALGALAGAAGERDGARLRTTDGYDVEPWVVLVQVVNHGNDHRRQLRGLLRALGVTPPDLDGWSFGEATGALTPIGA